MSRAHVDYDQIAPEYDRRYAVPGSHGRTDALLRLASSLQANRILEVGCGTGYWLHQLTAVQSALFGLDPSMGMLKQAKRHSSALHLIDGVAENLPFPSRTFDITFCVQAIHHLANPRRFVQEAHRVLERGGALAVVGSDPHQPQDAWYVYDFFEGTLATDVGRKPSWPTLTTWLEQAGFAQIDLTVVEEIDDPKQGCEVLSDPFLRKNGCSQLALLTDEAYAAGLARIKAALAAAEETGKPLVFPCRISIVMLTGRKLGPSPVP